MSGYQDNHARNAKYGVTVFDTIADMKAMLIFDDKFPQEIKILGTNTKGDGGDRSFYWDSTATEDGNDIDIVDLTNHSGNGRYKVLVEDETYYFEWGGFPEELTENHAYAINKVLMAAWRAGVGKCTLKNKRDGMRVWGAFLVSNIEQDYKHTEVLPFIPPVDDIPASKVISIFASGVTSTVPEDMVATYNLYNANAINPMINDPTIYPDHRYLHPIAPNAIDTLFLEFSSDIVFPPYTHYVQVNTAATDLAPGDIVGIFRPRYAEAIDQAMFEFNVVESINYQTINLTWPLNRPYHRDTWGVIASGSAHGGVAKVPENFALENSTVKNIVVNCSGIPFGRVLIRVWSPWASIRCKLENARIFGGEYNYALHPKGRYNEITNVHISGLGKLLANEQGCTENKYTNCLFQLNSWVQYAASYVSLTHFAETASAQFFNCHFVCPAFDAATGKVGSLTQWKGSVNNIFENCTFINFNNSIASVLQIDGWGHAKVKDNKFFGNAQTQLITARTSFYTTSAGNVAREIALHLQDNEFNLVESELDFTTLNVGNFSITTPVVITNNKLTIDYAVDRAIPALDSVWRADEALGANSVVRTDNLSLLRDEILFSGNTGILGIRKLWISAPNIPSNGIRTSYGEILAATGVLTYLHLDLTDLEFESRWIFGKMFFYDESGVGGVMRFGEQIVYDTANLSGWGSKDISYENKTVDATVDTQEMWLSESLRDSTNGLGPRIHYTAKIDGTNANHTVGNITIRGFEFYFLGGR